MLIFCPECQRQLRVPDEAAGKQAKCPSCQRVFTAGAAATGEEIQPPPAPRPSAPVSEPSEMPDVERRPRSDDSSTDDQRIDLRDDSHARHVAGAAAVWIFVAAAVALVAFAVSLVMTVVLGEIEDILIDFDPGDDEAFMAAMICGFGCCGSLLLGVFVTMIIAGLNLRSLGSKGWAITGVVEAFGLALFFGGRVLLNAIHMLVDTPDALDHWVPVKLMLDILAAALASFAGVKAILALNDPAVSAEFEWSRSRRRRRRIRWDD